MIKLVRLGVATCAFLLAALPAAAGATAASSNEDSAFGVFVDQVMREQIREHTLSAAVISVVRDGQVIFARGYGQSDRHSGRAVDPAKSLFRIGSTSKLFTWTAVMQLVERGKLDLDRDVNVYLHGLRIPQAFGRPVTLRALLTHTAGFEDGGIGYLSHTDPRTDASIQRALATHMPARVRPPLTLPAYSNYGAALAGLIVEQVSGMSFNSYVMTHILAPLGMRYSTFAEPLPPALEPLRVITYEGAGSGARPRPLELVAGFRPAGSMSSSALDMAHFMIAHLQRGRSGSVQILRPETADLMHRTAFRTDPRLPGMALGFYEGQVGRYRMIGHGGATADFRSTMMLVPEKRLGIFIAYAGSSSAAHRAIVKAIVGHGEATPPPVIAKGRPEDRAAWLGSYQPSRRNFTRIDKLLSIDSQIDVSPHDNGGLRISGLGDADEIYLPQGNGLFRQVSGDRVIAFSRIIGGRAQVLATDTTPYAPAERVGWQENSTTWWWILLSGLIGLCTAPLLFLRRRRSVTRGAARTPTATAPQEVNNAKLRLIAPTSSVRPFASKLDLHRSTTTNTRIETWAIRAAALVVMVGLISVFGVSGAIVANIEMLEKPVTLSLKLALLLPICLLLTLLPLTWFTIAAWRAALLSRRRRIALTIILLSGSALCLFFNHWNLLGWRFG